MVGYNNGHQLWTVGVNFDKNSNIWVMNSATSRAVSVLKNGVWTNLNFDYLISKPTIPKVIFDKKDHENIGDFFIQELENREKVMDSLLASIDNMNQRYDKIMKGSMESNESYSKKAA